MWVSEQEKIEAKRYDVYSYLRIADPGELVRLSSNQYCLRSHDSFKISPKDGTWLWYWYSQEIGGRSAVDYLIKVKGYSFVDAVKEVNRVMKGRNPSFFMEKTSEKVFRVPPRCRYNDHAIDYLCSRGIDKKLIEELIQAGLVYQHRKYFSVVFIGKNDRGEPAHASYRMMREDGAKGDFGGSDKKYAFRLENDNADTVRVFESAIDLLSYVTLCKLWKKPWRHESLISTAGIAASRNEELKLPPALEHYLENHPDTENILIHFDNDKTGRRCAEQIERMLKDTYKIRHVIPKKGKDYNEYLQMQKRLLAREKSCNCR